MLVRPKAAVVQAQQLQQQGRHSSSGETATILMLLSCACTVWVRYLAGEDLLVLCGEVDFPPCLMVRRMLEGMMGLSKQVRRGLLVGGDDGGG